MTAKRKRKTTPSGVSQQLQPLNNAISIDVGWHTAVAEWRGGFLPQVFTISLPAKLKTKDTPWGVQLTEMALRFNNFMHRTPAGINAAYIEGVEMWEGNAQSMIAARRGNTFRLASLVGVYAGILATNGIAPTVLLPREWKGQLSKKIVEKRVYRVWAENGVSTANQPRYNDHIMDSIGIGFSVAGLL
jgi:hypothetical protein